MVAVLLVSTYWGLGLGLLTALASALAFNFFHTPPTGHFTIANAQNYVALGVFLIAAAIASTVAELARSRAREAERRSEEADLAAELARLLLGGTDLRGRPRLHRASLGRGVRPAVGGGGAPPRRRRSAAPRPAAGNRRRPGGDPAGLCLDRPRDPGAPARSSRAGARGAACRRPRSRRPAGRGRGDAGPAPPDSVKTALLRAVSHDLRTPLTTIVAASAAVRSPRLSSREREELGESIGQQAGRLSRLVDQLLDLSRLEAGTAHPRREWCSIEELIRSAADEVGDRGRRGSRWPSTPTCR